MVVIKMKVFRIVIIIFLVFLLANLIIPSPSESYTPSDPLTEEEKTKISEDRKITTTNSPKEYPIESYSVDASDSSFAVLYCYNTILSSLNSSEVKEICVYNADGSFKYAVCALYSGSVEILLDEGLLYVLPYRGDIVCVYDSDGNLADMINIASCREEYEKKFESQQTVVGDLEYSMEDRAFGLTPSYQTLRVTDTIGEQKILYQSKSAVNFGDAVMLTALLLFFVCGIPLVIYKKQNG